MKLRIVSMATALATTNGFEDVTINGVLKYSFGQAFLKVVTQNETQWFKKNNILYLKAIKEEEVTP